MEDNMFKRALLSLAVKTGVTIAAVNSKAPPPKAEPATTCLIMEADESPLRPEQKLAMWDTTDSPRCEFASINILDRWHQSFAGGANCGATHV